MAKNIILIVVGIISLLVSAITPFPMMLGLSGIVWLEIAYTTYRNNINSIGKDYLDYRDNRVLSSHKHSNISSLFLNLSSHCSPLYPNP